MNASEVVRRARSAIGAGAIYKLGKGGFNPHSIMPFGKEKLCDCSGFVAWCLGVSRFTDHEYYKTINGGWLNTTAIHADALSPFGFFDRVDPERARPGMLLVFPAGKSKYGHVGVVSAVANKEPAKVIHCSAGNHKATGDAIQETSTDVFDRAGAIVVRCCLVS